MTNILMDFIPGKKYKAGNLPYIFVGWTVDNRSVWTDWCGDVHAFSRNVTEETEWKEYKEPIEHKCYVNFIRRLDGSVAKVLTLYDPLQKRSMEAGHTLLHTQEVKYVEKPE